MLPYLIKASGESDEGGSSLAFLSKVLGKENSTGQTQTDSLLTPRPTLFVIIKHLWSKGKEMGDGQEHCKAGQKPVLAFC